MGSPLDEALAPIGRGYRLQPELPGMLLVVGNLSTHPWPRQHHAVRATARGAVAGLPCLTRVCAHFAAWRPALMSQLGG
jgi:hypothetical protein